MPLDSPRPSLPSLNALRAFEAAARHESFVKAADELHVTAGAIAQQVKLLEVWSGRPLFQRLTHGVRLTSAARSILPRMVEAFDSLGLAVQALRGVDRSAEVRIAALPSVAILWLSPRLSKLRRSFPDLEISVSAIEQPPNFCRDLYDLALFFVESDAVDDEAVILSEDALFPVCSPDLLDGVSPLNTPSDLASHTLLHDSVWRDDWERWMRHVEERTINPLKGATFSLYSLAVQAALDGNGVLMGHEALIAPELKTQQLVMPFDLTKLRGAPLTLLIPKRYEKKENINDLIVWFMQ